jgi:putative tricarboxylic transport membrane protein
LAGSRYYPMDLRSRSDLISGIFVAAFGLYVTASSSRLDYVSEYGPGPGFLPFWLGIGLFALAVYLAVRNLIGQVREPSKAESWTAVGRVLSGWLALMVAVFLLPWIGFSLTLALLTTFLIIVLERRSRWTGVGVGFGLAIGFYLIFVFALGLSLPVNRWGF